MHRHITRLTIKTWTSYWLTQNSTGILTTIHTCPGILFLRIKHVGRQADSILGPRHQGSWSSRGLGWPFGFGCKLATQRYWRIRFFTERKMRLNIDLLLMIAYAITRSLWYIRWINIIHITMTQAED